MTSGSQALPPALSPRRTRGARAARPRDSRSAWPLIDRLGYALCWAAGLALCAIAGGIVLFMFVKGITYLRLSLLVQSPSPSVSQSGSGGFLDPVEGTLIITLIGICLAAPTGVALAAWLSEYHRPAWLARAVESAIEMIAGVPSLLLAIFGLLVFAPHFLAFLSQTSAGGSVYGKSLLIAGMMMSVLALPLIVGATREALAQIPGHVREASYALGKTKATTLRRVLLPSIRTDIAAGVTLGIGRIIGDTAIVVILAGGTLQLDKTGSTPILSTLRATGSSLTSYIFYNSPLGEGHSPQKAYAAAFLLLIVVLGLNMVVTLLSSERRFNPLASMLIGPWARRLRGRAQGAETEL
jgi:phosphate transport system permease protein